MKCYWRGEQNRNCWDFEPTSLGTQPSYPYPPYLTSLSWVLHPHTVLTAPFQLRPRSRSHPEWCYRYCYLQLFPTGHPGHTPGLIQPFPESAGQQTVEICFCHQPGPAWEATAWPVPGLLEQELSAPPLNQSTQQKTFINLKPSIKTTPLHPAEQHFCAHLTATDPEACDLFCRHSSISTVAYFPETPIWAEQLLSQWLGSLTEFFWCKNAALLVWALVCPHLSGDRSGSLYQEAHFTTTHFLLKFRFNLVKPSLLLKWKYCLEHNSLDSETLGTGPSVTEKKDHAS